MNDFVLPLASNAYPVGKVGNVMEMVYVRPGSCFELEICSGGLTLNDPKMFIPDAWHRRSEDESDKKYGLLADNEHVALEIVAFNVAVTVTQVPGGPTEGNRLILVILKPVVAALTGAGDATSETERNSAEVSSTNTQRELALRVPNLEHITIIPLIVPI